MSSQEYHEGQRLSLKEQLCTVRYAGPVQGKPGEWLGVEWDDTQRGKHDGTHEGRQYFACRSRSPAAASFLRPNQPWDHPRTFLQALTEKYMSAETHETAQQKIYISGKQAEEVGFSKFSKRQARLQGIHVLVLDRMGIKHERASLSEADHKTIADQCAEITVLDLSRNLFESFEEIAGLCALFPKLQSLTLDGNRFTVNSSEAATTLPSVRSLALSGTLLTEHELSHVLSAFPSLESLEHADNERSAWSFPTLCPHLTTLDLSSNTFTSLADIHNLDHYCPHLQTLLLQHNRISSVHPTPSLPPTLRDLSLSHNALATWNPINALLPLTHLRALRVTGNPLYTALRAADDKPLTPADGYMLTIARLPQLATLNYSRISDKERLNAETYYLGQIAIELGLAGEGAEGEVLARHPRYGELCEEYGEPAIQRTGAKEEVDPRSLAARLVRVEFRLADANLPAVKQRAWRTEVPKALDVYAVLGIVGKKIGLSPLELDLVLETGERDPTARDSGYDGPEWWDSSDEDEEGGSERSDEDWTTRGVELVPSTRAIGTYVEGREARVTVRTKGS